MSHFAAATAVIVSFSSTFAKVVMLFSSVYLLVGLSVSYQYYLESYGRMICNNDHVFAVQCTARYFCSKLPVRL